MGWGFFPTWEEFDAAEDVRMEGLIKFANSPACPTRDEGESDQGFYAKVVRAYELSRQDAAHAMDC